MWKIHLSVIPRGQWGLLPTRFCPSTQIPPKMPREANWLYMSMQYIRHITMSAVQAWSCHSIVWRSMEGLQRRRPRFYTEPQFEKAATWLHAGRQKLRTNILIKVTLWDRNREQHSTNKNVAQKPQGTLYEGLEGLERKVRIWHSVSSNKWLPILLSC